LGQEIADSHFSPEDFVAFGERLERETQLLGEWLREGRFQIEEHVGGFELEAWLVDDEGNPAPVNEACLERLNDPFVVPELAKFNLELNGEPAVLRGDALSRLAGCLGSTWSRCSSVARDYDTFLAMIGILPTVTQEHLGLHNMSPLQRYRALDEQLFRLRGGAPLEMDIEGNERLRFTHHDVMLESATTSFQIHLKVGADEAVRCYNASKIIAAPMVAISANSPFLFGKDLWHETRIPLFEQAVYIGPSERVKRVGFGIRYLHESVLECFQANIDRYTVLLPRLMDEPEEQLAHLRLHNGTIWRWNRPLVGINEEGVPHLRIEHRVVPAGPTLDDCIANAAFYFGAVRALAGMVLAPEGRLPFEAAKRNFYTGARYGLEARLQWLDGKTCSVVELCRDCLLPLARQGLRELGIDHHEIDHWLGIIEGRLEVRQNGAVWQRAWVGRHGCDMQALTLAYLERQVEGDPVHRWGLV
jgi:gamma-glutamyl:cysteine ligase YbdK (ATP-grasp superfamily)